MTLNNVYLGVVSIVTNKDKDGTSTIRDTKFYKVTLLLQYKYLNNIVYEDLESDELYYLDKFNEIGDKFVDSRFELKNFGEILGRKHMIKPKVLKKYRFGKSFIQYRDSVM